MRSQISGSEFRPVQKLFSTITQLSTCLNNISTGKGFYVISLSHKQFMDKELIILEQIQNNPHVNQRDLATVAKASLGMTNAILKRFVEKGLITIKKVNNRNIRYALTAEGMEEINRRSWGYFKRTIKNVVDYKDVIWEVIRQAKVDGYEGIILVGVSDFDFIIEHLCYKIGMPFLYLENADGVVPSEQFRLIAETLHSDALKEQLSDEFYLSRLIIS